MGNPWRINPSVKKEKVYSRFPVLQNATLNATEQSQASTQASEIKYNTFEQHSIVQSNQWLKSEASNTNPGTKAARTTQTNGAAQLEESASFSHQKKFPVPKSSGIKDSIFVNKESQGSIHLPGFPSFPKNGNRKGLKRKHIPIQPDLYAQQRMNKFVKQFHLRPEGPTMLKKLKHK